MDRNPLGPAPHTGGKNHGWKGFFLLPIPKAETSKAQSQHARKDIGKQTQSTWWGQVRTSLGWALHSGSHSHAPQGPAKHRSLSCLPSRPHSVQQQESPETDEWAPKGLLQESRPPGQRTHRSFPKFPVQCWEPTTTDQILSFQSKTDG